jgi:hypothetical protein
LKPITASEAGAFLKQASRGARKTESSQSTGVTIRLDTPGAVVYGLRPSAVALRRGTVTGRSTLHESYMRK